MPREKLQQTLQALHEELSTADEVDPRTRAQLEQLTHDIRRLVDAEEDDAPLAEQLHEQLVKFETDHPRLTSAMNQVAAALANLGI